MRVAYVTMQFPVPSESFAAVELRALRRLLEREVKFRRLEDAPIPLTVIAADVLTALAAAQHPS